METPFIIYADVEALLKKPTEEFCKSGSTTAYQEHEVYSIGYYLKCSFDESASFYKAKRGPDCIDWFIAELHEAAMTFGMVFDNLIPIRMTEENEENFKKAEFCYICEKRFEKGRDIVVRDHSHFTGEYRGAAHQECNLQYRDFRTVPVVFHNLTHYDSHFLVRKLATGFDGDLKVIPINSEKYISFIKTVSDSSGDFKSKVKFKFIDSFRFLASSLDYLASLNPSGGKTLLRNEFTGFTEEQIQLLERKGVFCYDYVDSWEKLEETSLPPRDAFYSKLIGEDISVKAYA